MGGRCPCRQGAVPVVLCDLESSFPGLCAQRGRAGDRGRVGDALGTRCALQGCGRRNAISQWWLRGCSPLSFLAWKNPERCRGPSCQPQLHPAGEPAGLEGGWCVGGGGHFLLPPSCSLCWPFPSGSCRLRVCAGVGGGLWGQLLVSAAGLGVTLGVGVTQGHALERGGNAAFCDSSVFLRSS